MMILEMDWTLFWTALGGIGGLAAVITIIIAILNNRKKKRNTLIHACNELCDAMSIGNINTLLNKLSIICDKGMNDASAIIEIQSNLQQTVHDVKARWRKMQLLLKSSSQRAMRAKMDTIVENYHYCMRDVETIVAALGCESVDEIEKHISDENSQEMCDIISTTSNLYDDVPAYVKQIISLRFKDLRVPDYSTEMRTLFNNQYEDDRLFSIHLQAIIGNAISQNALGDYCSKQKQFKKAFKWYKKSAEQGLATAQCKVGLCYELGIGVATDEKEAFRWYKKSAEQDFAIACFRLSRYYAEGIGVDKDEKEAFRLIKEASEQGNAEAQYTLGLWYAQGIGVATDEKEAFRWYKKSAEQDFAKAQHNVGICYMQGNGVDKDEKEAFEWFKKSAEQGVAEAQYTLGMCYAEGIGVDKDEKEEFEWFKKSAEQGFAVAQLNVGICYDKGTGCVQDYNQAFRWYTKASENKENEEVYSRAMYCIGFMYLEGTIGFGSPTTAFQYFQIAAQHGNASAQHVLGFCYENGKVVEVEIEKAKYWYGEAAKQGNMEAIDALNRLKSIGKESS